MQVFFAGILGMIIHAKAQKGYFTKNSALFQLMAISGGLIISA